MSMSHLILLAVIAIIVIPPDKLPEVARQVGRFLNEMRRMSAGILDDLKPDLLKPEDMMKQKNSGFSSASNPTDPTNTIHKDANLSMANQVSKEPTLTAEQLAAVQALAHQDYLKTITTEPVAETSSATAEANTSTDPQPPKKNS